MALSNITPLIFFSMAFLVACDGGQRESDNGDVNVFSLENTPIDNSASIMDLNQRELNILNVIKQRSTDDGARYQFDQLNPVFDQDGDVMNVKFNYVGANTVGGSPIVEYSVSQRTITSIVYTQ